MLADATARIFADLADPQALVHATDAQWKPKLWQALEDAGLTRAWVPEALGGAGAAIGDGFEILRVAGAYAVAVPLAETLLAGWLLAQAGLNTPGGMLCVAPVRANDEIRLGPDGTLTGRAHAVPFARDADRIALAARHERGFCIALVDPAQCATADGIGGADGADADLVFANTRPEILADARPGFTDETLRAMGAAARAVQMSGALQAILERSVAYARERVAFERQIGKFQAIQHSLARLAGEAAAALAAAGSVADALETVTELDDALILEVAAAKIRVGEAAGAGAAVAHQVHGAIGFSAEHALHRFTQRLWSWRDDFGDESIWAVRLGRLVAARGADALWPLLASR